MNIYIVFKVEVQHTFGLDVFFVYISHKQCDSHSGCHNLHRLERNCIFKLVT